MVFVQMFTEVFLVEYADLAGVQAEERPLLSIVLYK